MSVKKYLIAAAALSVFSHQSAQAGEVYVLGSAGVSESSHSIERNLGENPPELPSPDAGGVTSVDEDGASFSLGAGYRTNVPGSPVFIGVEGFYTFEDIESRNINGVLITDVDVDGQYGGRVLLGYDVNDRVKVYAHGGVSWIDFDLTNSYTFADPVTSRSETEAAFAYGAGAEFEVIDKVGVFVEYTRTTEVAFDGIPEVAGDTGRVNYNELALDRLALGFRWAL